MTAIAVPMAVATAKARGEVSALARAWVTAATTAAATGRVIAMAAAWVEARAKARVTAISIE